jgi:hypothetical protein
MIRPVPIEDQSRRLSAAFEKAEGVRQGTGLGIGNIGHVEATLAFTASL